MVYKNVMYFLAWPHDPTSRNINSNTITDGFKCGCVTIDMVLEMPIGDDSSHYERVANRQLLQATLDHIYYC